LSEDQTRAAQEVNPYHEVTAQQAAKVAMLQAAVSDLTVKLASIDHELAVCQWWDREFPRFRTWLFDAIVDTLAAEANRWLSIMSGGVVWLQVTTQVQRSKQLKDELGVTVFRWNTDGTISSRPYRVWSGGEKRRVALAVDLALSKLMASRASKAYRFLALDEVDRHLDARGRDGLRKVLEELREEKDTTLVITHDPEFRASFDRELIVTKQHGASAWEVRSGPHKEQKGGGGGGAEATPAQKNGARDRKKAPVVQAGAILGGSGKAGGEGQRRGRASRRAHEIGEG
jgi:DNA repair exonuclease SbcCD ATPase subunit